MGSEVLSRQSLFDILYFLFGRVLGESAKNDLMRRVEVSHEALRERVEQLERLILAHSDAQSALRSELDFAGVSLDLSKHYERADAQLRAALDADDE